MSIQIVTPPAALPLDLAEIKAIARITFANGEDGIIRRWLGAATNYAENITRKSLVVARFKQVLDGFPGMQMPGGVGYGNAYARPGNAIYLERGPVLNVVSIQYVEVGSGQVKTVGVDDSVEYVVDYAYDPVRITPKFGQIWPISQPQIGSVWITFDAGYAAKITANPTADTISPIGWPALKVDDVVRLTNSGGDLPAPLQQMTDYFVKSVVSPGVYTLAATAGGTQIDITDPGGGTSYLFGVPDGIIAWLTLRAQALFENREEVVASPGLTVIASLPFADRLLDGFVTYI
jgi:hypothetical protein